MWVSTWRNEEPRSPLISEQLSWYGGGWVGVWLIKVKCEGGGSSEAMDPGTGSYAMITDRRLNSKCLCGAPEQCFYKAPTGLAGDGDDTVELLLKLPWGGWVNCEAEEVREREKKGRRYGFVVDSFSSDWSEEEFFRHKNSYLSS